jgi:carboxypeptidase C (cathepsin A)
LLRTPLRLAGIAASMLLLPIAFAQDKPADKPDAAAKSAPMIPAPPIQPDSTTEGSVTVDGKAIGYRAVAGILTIGSSDTQDAQLALDGRYLPGYGEDLPPKPDEQPATARMFYVAYFMKDAPKNRPITFLYNGGPGSPTMYLHMGAFGPVRVVTPDVQHQESAPYELVANQYSLLDASDLVFIDAPGTGFSRVLGKDAMKAFYGTDEDGHAFDRFIRRFLTKYDRWNSPKFIFGESYGTTRSAVVARMLQGVDLNGVVLLSQILSFDDSADGPEGNPGTDNAYMLALPSMAATAWYHHRLASPPASLDALLSDVEKFSLGDYAAALHQGADLPDDQKHAIAAKLETYTGVPAAYWYKADLRVSGGEFSKELQSEMGITTGRLDTRYSGPDMDPLSENAGYDPFGAATTPAFLAAINEYARDTLHYGDNLTYKPSAREPGFHWNMEHTPPGTQGWDDTSVNVMPDLAFAMKRNPKMKVMLMGGYFDLGCTFFGATYEMKHLPIPQSLESNISYHWFQTGHMVYVNDDALRQLHGWTAEFIRSNESGK